MTFRHKTKKNQPTIHKTYLDLMYMGSRKRQDLLSKLGAWGPQKRIEREGRGTVEGGGEKYIAQ